MATLYHGTTLENWNKIKQEGFNGFSRQVTWNCSLDEVYFWDRDKVRECEFDMSDDESVEYAEDSCIQKAFEQAQITASTSNYLGTELVVIKLDIADDLVGEDLSCPGGPVMGASTVQPEDIDLASDLVAVYQADDGYSPSMRMVVVSWLVGHNDLLSKGNYSQLECELAHLFHRNNVDYTDVIEFDWYEKQKEDWLELV